MDDRGIVIFMVDEKMSPAVGKQLLKVRRAQQSDRFVPVNVSAERLCIHLRAQPTL